MINAIPQREVTHERRCNYCDQLAARHDMKCHACGCSDIRRGPRIDPLSGVHLTAAEVGEAVEVELAAVGAALDKVNESLDAYQIPKPVPSAALLEKAIFFTAALRRIAAFNDEAGDQNLAATGCYSSFDEPYSVEIAREALAQFEPVTLPNGTAHPDGSCAASGQPAPVPVPPCNVVKPLPGTRTVFVIVDRSQIGSRTFCRAMNAAECNAEGVPFEDDSPRWRNMMDGAHFTTISYHDPDDAQLVIDTTLHGGKPEQWNLVDGRILKPSSDLEDEG